MSSLRIKRTIATALTGAAVASALAAPAMSADSSQYVPPPPSSIAAGAAEEYDELRSRGAAPADSQPVVDEPAPGEGFDVLSAAIGAAAGTGLVVLLLTVGALTGRRPLTRRHGTAGA